MTKLSANGDALVYSTYFPEGSGIGVDSLGNAYVTGGAISNFPFTAWFPASCDISVSDSLYVAKLNDLGSALIYSACVKGMQTSSAGIAVDANGGAYVSGYSWGSNLETTPGSFQTTPHGGYNAFILKMTSVSSLSTNNLDFHTQPLGVSSDTQTVTLSNDSPSAFTVNTATLSGTHAEDFQVADTCSGKTLTPQANCNIGVRFTPLAVGSHTSALVIADTASDSPVNATVGGTGVDFVVESTPASVSIKAGQTASYSISLSPQGGAFNNNISLACLLPSALEFTSCSFSPASVTPASKSATATLAVRTSGPSALAVPIGPHVPMQLFAFLLLVYRPGNTLT